MHARSKRMIATAELLLILPAALFMTTLLARNVTQAQYEPAFGAQRFVAWSSGLPVPIGLWGLLIALPMLVLVVGCAVLVGSWDKDAEFREAVQSVATAMRSQTAICVVTAAMLTAAGVLAVVAVHVLTN